MRRWLLVVLLMSGSLGAPCLARAQNRQQALVDRATLALQDMLSGPKQGDRLKALRQARAVMICPQVFKAGFVVGGAGGGCVLVARDGGGGWSSPAFYVMGTGSFGLQVGVQDAEIIMMILTSKGFDAIMDAQFKFGGDASVAVANIGAGVEGDTTAALRADIVAYSQTRGLFAGVSLNGSILTSDTAWNRAYYGSDLAARQIVLQMQVNNPGANPLRASLNRYGARGGGYEPAGGGQPYGQSGGGQGGDGQGDSAPYSPEDRGAVSQQSLPPPGH